MLFATSYAFSQVKKKLNQAAVPADFEKEMLKEYIQHMKIKDDTSARKIIKSKAGSFYFAPKYFYIQQIEIFPELKDDSAGFTLQPKSGKMQTLAFEKGTIGFFKNHLDKSIARVDSLYPVTIRIKKLNITEKRTDIIYDDCILKFEYVFECR